MSSTIARTLPSTGPAATTSPVRRVPFWISRVATGPLALSRCASITVPFAILSGLACRSSTSDTSRIISSSLSMFSPLMALTGTITVLPPQSSATSSWPESSCFTRSGEAPSLSILLIATTIGTLAARAWLIASRVWGRTPSSAATTSTAMSVTLVPRARMAVKASWPGVSRKVSLRASPAWSTSTW